VNYGSRVGREPWSSLVEDGERIEAPFGQALLRSEEGGAFLLTLHELQDVGGLLCMGVYIPSSVPMAGEIELLARQRVMEEIQSRLDTRGSGDYRQFRYNAGGSLLRGEATLSDSRDGVERWTGRVEGLVDPFGSFSFSLERYESPEIALTLVTMLFLLYFVQKADMVAEDCYNQALEACGQGQVKNLRFKRTWQA
jgi:hypothetical protein